MAKRSRGRPAEPKKKERNADRVFVRLAMDRTLAAMGPVEGVDQQGRLIKNTLSGKRPKGQQRSPRAMGKELLPEVAAEIGQQDHETPSPRTLERHYAEHGGGSLSRIATEIANRLRQADKVCEEQAKARANNERPRVEALNRIAKKMQRQPLRKVFRNK